RALRPDAVRLLVARAAGSGPDQVGRRRSRNHQGEDEEQTLHGRRAVYTLTVRIWGLTGNIGSGKSAVARLLVARGIPVVDADRIAREVVEPGTPALAEIAGRFPGVIGADGSLDR